MSRVLPVLSLTLSTMDRARCLYALLTEATIDYGSVVMATMILVQLVDLSTVLPYGALITQIVQNAKVVIEGMIELVPEKGPITSCYSMRVIPTSESLHKNRDPSNGGW